MKEISSAKQTPTHIFDKRCIQFSTSKIRCNMHIAGGLNYQTYLFTARPPPLNYNIYKFIDRRPVLPDSSRTSAGTPPRTQMTLNQLMGPSRGCFRTPPGPYRGDLITTFTNLLSAGLSRIILSPSRPAGCAERVTISK